MIALPPTASAHPPTADGTASADRVGAAPPGAAGGDPARRRRHSVLLGAAQLEQLTDGELIATVIGGPEPAAEVLHCAARLARLPFWQRRALGVAGLVSEHGVPPQRAVRLASLWELADRWYPDDRPEVTSPRDAVLLLDGLRRLKVERVVVILLDARRRLLRTETVAHGTHNASRFQPRDVLRPALTHNASALILAHNHPSGDPVPSAADRRVTDTMREAAALVGMVLVDHVIVAARSHHSFCVADAWPAETGA